MLHFGHAARGDNANGKDEICRHERGLGGHAKARHKRQAERYFTQTDQACDHQWKKRMAERQNERAIPKEGIGQPVAEEENQRGQQGREKFRLINDVENERFGKEDLTKNP